MSSNDQSSTATTGHQKIEPLSKNELLYGGISIIVLMILAVIFEANNANAFAKDSNGVFTEQDLIDFHNILSDNEFVAGFLVQLAIQILTFPFYILYYISIIRTFKVCFSRYYILRETFSISFITAFVMLYFGIFMDIMSTIFDYSVTDQSGNVIASIYMIQITIYRMSTISTTFAVYFGMISQNALWIAILKAGGIDKHYNADLSQYVFPRKCQGILTKITLILLILLNSFGALISMFSWSKSGFFTPSGDASMLIIFVIICETLSGIWLIWLAISKKYQNFNNKLQFIQF